MCWVSPQNPFKKLLAFEEAPPGPNIKLVEFVHKHARQPASPPASPLASHRPAGWKERRQVEALQKMMLLLAARVPFDGPPVPFLTPFLVGRVKPY